MARIHQVSGHMPPLICGDRAKSRTSYEGISEMYQAGVDECIVSAVTFPSFVESCSNRRAPAETPSSVMYMPARLTLQCKAKRQ